MENTSFENIYFDYYANTTSYVKTIMELLPNEEVAEDKRYAIQVIYNYLLNNANEMERNNVSRLSKLFNEKIGYLPKEEVIKQVRYLYNNFLNSMVHDFINRDKIFNILNDCIEAYVRYCPSYHDIAIDLENNSFDNIHYDYYSTTNSYVKAIMDMLPEDKVSYKTRLLIKTAFNYVMNNLSDIKREEISLVSSKFIEKLNCLPMEEVNEHIDYIYHNFLKIMVDDFASCDKIFDIMNESVKVISGYYSAYESINIIDVNDIKVERGSYR